MPGGPANGERTAATAVGILMLVAGPGILAGCAHRTGAQTAAGALQTLQEQAEQEEPGRRPAELVAARMVDGALAQLETPEHVATLRMLAGATAASAMDGALQSALHPGPLGERSAVDRLTDEMAGSFRLALTHGLEDDLGPSGPLADRLGRLAHLAAAEATDGAVSRLLPGCRPDDAACLDRRLASLSREAAVGFATGLRESLGLPALVLAFLCGGAATLIVLMAFRREGRRRAPQPAPRPARVS